MDGCGRLYAVHCSVPFFFHLTCLSHLPSTQRNSTSLFDYPSASEPHHAAQKATYQNLTAFPFLNNAEFNIILFWTSLVRLVLLSSRASPSRGETRCFSTITYGQWSSLLCGGSSRLKRSVAKTSVHLFPTSKCLIPFASTGPHIQSKCLHVHVFIPWMSNVFWQYIIIWLAAKEECCDTGAGSACQVMLQLTVLNSLTISSSVASIVTPDQSREKLKDSVTQKIS